MPIGDPPATTSPPAFKTRMQEIIDAVNDHEDRVDDIETNGLVASMYDANTILVADTDDTPVARTVAASRILGRKATGGIDDMTTAEVAALFGTPDGSKFLADDGTLKVPPGGGGGTVTFMGCRVYLTGALNFTNNDQTPIAWDTESYDTDTMHDNSTNPSRLTVPTGGDGYWLVSGRVWYNGSDTGTREASILKNGTQVAVVDTEPGGTGSIGVAVSDVIAASAGDYFQLAPFQNSGGTRAAVTGSAFSCFSAHFVGA